MLKMYYRQFDRLSPIKEEDYCDGYLKVHGVLITTDGDFEFMHSNYNKDFFTGCLIECDEYSNFHRLYKVYYEVDRDTGLDKIDYNRPYLIENSTGEEECIEDFTMYDWLNFCNKYEVVGIEE